MGWGPASLPTGTGTYRAHVALDVSNDLQDWETQAEAAVSWLVNERGASVGVLGVDPRVEGGAGRLHPPVLVGDDDAVRGVGVEVRARRRGLSDGGVHPCAGGDEEDGEAAG